MTLEGLGAGAATATLNVILGNGEAFVQVKEGGVVADQVTFVGNFTAASDFTLTSESGVTNGGEVVITGSGLTPRRAGRADG